MWLPELVVLVVVAAASLIAVAPCTLCHYSVSRISSPLPPFDQRRRVWVGGLLRRLPSYIMVVVRDVIAPGSRRFF